MPTDYRFLPDQPLREEKELQNANFGHRDIATILVSMIKKCKSPFSIALSGKWGSGKSSIANLVQDKLKDDADLAIIYFDIWKYEGDALRRSFLKEAVKQLKDIKRLPENFNLTDRLENSVTRTSNGELKLKEKILKQLKYPTLLVLAGLAVIIVVAAYLHSLPTLWDSTKLAVQIGGGIVGGGAFVLWILKTVSQVFTTETYTFGSDRFKDPHEFEDEFGNLLCKLESKKLLVIFDNLDRVTHDKALEVLSTIKTFLEPKDIENTEKEVVFLIPCDIEAIKEHIRQVYAPKGGQLSPSFKEDEFLRKFFNTIVPIPNFIVTELEDFAKKLLKQTGVPEFEDDTVAWIITKVFRENPRQIKQFINSLLSAYLLVQERKNQKTLGDNDITVPQLAKFLIIESKHNKALEELQQLKEWDLGNLSTAFLNGQPEIKKFLTDTNHVPINNLQIFLTFRHSEQEQRLPGFELFIVALKDKNVAEADKFIQNIPNFEDIKTDLTQAIKGVWDSTGNKDSCFSIISTLLPILTDKGLKLNGSNGYDIFANFLSEEKIEYLKAVEPMVIFNQILESSSSYRNKIIERYVQILEKQGSGAEVDQIKPEYGYSLVEQISKHSAWFASRATRIQNILIKSYPNYPQMISLFSEGGKPKKEFVPASFVQAYINNITTAEIDGEKKSKFDNRMENLKLLGKEDWDAKTTGILLEKTSQLVLEEIAKEANAEQITRLDYFLNKLDGLLKNIPEALSKGKDKISVFAQGLIQGANAIPDSNNRKIYIPLLFSVRPFADKESLPQADTIVTSFINDGTVKADALDYVNNLIGPNWLADNSPFNKILIARSISDLDVFRWHYDKIQPTAQTNLLKGLIESSVDNFIKIAGEFKNSFPDNKSTADSILVKLSTKKIGAANRTNLYEICNILRCGDDEALQAKFNQHLIDTLKSDEKELQVAAAKGFGDSTYLSEEQKRKTVKDISSWLIENGTPPHQPECVRVVVNGWGLLSTQTPKKAEFLQFVFDRLLIKSNNLDSIALGYESLTAVQPFGLDQRSLFDDLRQQIIDHSDKTISNALKEGLLKLKEVSEIPDEDEYWDVLLGREKKKEESPIIEPAKEKAVADEKQ